MRRQQPTQRLDLSSRWRNHPARSPSNIPIPPATGKISPPPDLPEGKNTQSMEQSSRKSTLQRPHSSSQRKNQPVYKHPKVRKHPVSGRIFPPTGLPASRSLQPLEKSSRKPALQRAKHPASGKKTGRLLRRTLLRYTARHSRTMHGTKFPSDSRGPALQAQARAPSQTRRTPDTPLPSLKGFRNTAIVEKWEIEKRLQFQRTRPRFLKRSLGGGYHGFLEFL